MKKIAFYIESMVLGGAERSLLDIVNYLDPNLFDITIISIFKYSVYQTAETYDFSSYVNKNIHVITLVDNSNQFLYKTFNRFYAHTNISLIYSFLVRERYDIEVAFYEGMPTEFVAFSTNKESKKYAWLHTDNGPIYDGRPDELVKKQESIYRRYDSVIAVSDHVKESFNRVFPDVSCITIYNGIDRAKIRELAKEERDIEKPNKTTFITVGRLIQIKGYDRLLSAMNRLKREGFDFVLLMVGDGADRTKLENYILQNGLSDNVKLLGKTDNPYKYFKYSDVFICSSLIEGFGLAIVEAMSCGLPILTTELPAVEEILDVRENGIVCENSEEGLYCKIKEVLTDPKKLYGLDRLSLAQSERFDIAEQIRKIQGLFIHGKTET